MYQSTKIEECSRRGSPATSIPSACKSGRENCCVVYDYILVQNFLYNGAVAFIGYWWSVMDYDAYLFARAFYNYVSRGYTVFEAFKMAREDVPNVKDNVRLYGNGGIRLAD